MTLNQEIIQLLESEGCKIIGFVDLKLLPQEYQEARQGADYAIIMGEPYGSAEGIRKNLEGDRAIESLERYRAALKELLKAKKYKSDIKYITTTITYKMLATLAGIGWIGKCAVLTTEKWGGTLRLASIATNAPLVADMPITKSQCPPNCYICAEVCHAGAIKKNGVLWERFPDGTGIHRDEFFDVAACRKGREQHTPSSKGRPVCGKCIAACPYTQSKVSKV